VLWDSRNTARHGNCNPSAIPAFAHVSRVLDTALMLLTWLLLSFLVTLRNCLSVDTNWKHVVTFTIRMIAKAIIIASTKHIANSCIQQQFTLSCLFSVSQIIHKNKMLGMTVRKQKTSGRNNMRSLKGEAVCHMFLQYSSTHKFPV
jgi:hypothetical protein